MFMTVLIIGLGVLLGTMLSLIITVVLTTNKVVMGWYVRRYLKIINSISYGIDYESL